MADTHTKIDCIRWEDGEVYDINLPRTATPHITTLGVDEKILTGDDGLPEDGYTAINKGTIKVKPASTETKPQLELLSTDQSSTAEISAQVKSQNADGYVISDNATLTLKSLGVVRGGDSVYNTFTISADYDGTQRIGDFLVNNISRGGLQFLHGFKATQNVIFNKDIKVDGSIICKELKLHPTATEPLKLPSIWVGGDVDATNNTITAKTLKCDKITPATLSITSVDIPECSITTCVVSSDITVPLIRGIDDESGDPTPIEIENPINVTGGGTNSFVGDINCEAVTSRTACMTTAVGADKAAFNQNDVITLVFNETEKCYKREGWVSSTSGGSDIETGADPLLTKFKDMFNGFVQLQIEYLNDNGSQVFSYQLPSILYFNQTEEKKLSFDLPAVYPPDLINSHPAVGYINNGILEFNSENTATGHDFTVPTLMISRKDFQGSGVVLNNGVKVMFWDQAQTTINKFIEIGKIQIRVRKFN